MHFTRHAALSPRSSDDRAGAGQGFRRRIRRRPVEGEEREEVGDLLGRELLLDLFGHERDLGRLQLLDLVARDRLELAALNLQHDAFLAILGQESGQDAAVGRGDRGRLVAGTDDQARVEDVRHELVEVVPAVRSEVGTDLLALTVDLVALGAELGEDGLAGDGVARRLSDRDLDPGDDPLATRVATLTDRAPDRLDPAGDLAIPAPLELAGAG